MPRRTHKLVLLFLLVGACSSGDSNPGSTAGQSESPTANASTAAPSPSASLTVSAEALCIEMVDHLDTAQNLVSAFADNAQRFGDNGGVTKIEKVLDDLGHDREIAPTPFQNGLDIQIQFLEDIATYLGVGGEKDWDFRNFRSSGIDLAVQCRNAVE